MYSELDIVPPHSPWTKVKEEKNKKVVKRRRGPSDPKSKSTTSLGLPYSLLRC
jgi:hypothetical protein